MADSLWQNQLILQLLSRSPTPWLIDAEIGDLSDDLLGSEPALSYLRYDALLEKEGLRLLGLDDLAGKAEELRDMSAAANRFDLAAIGEAAAREQVLGDHFPVSFDIHPRAGGGE